MKLTIRLKVTKKRGFTVSLENTFLERNRRELNKTSSQPY